MGHLEVMGTLKPCCNQIHLNFLHYQAVGTLKYFKMHSMGVRMAMFRRGVSNTETAANKNVGIDAKALFTRSVGVTVSVIA